MTGPRSARGLWGRLPGRRWRRGREVGTTEVARLGCGLVRQCRHRALEGRGGRGGLWEVTDGGELVAMGKAPVQRSFCGAVGVSADVHEGDDQAMPVALGARDKRVVRQRRVPGQVGGQAVLGRQL